MIYFCFFLKVEGQERVCVCVWLNLSYIPSTHRSLMLILADISHYSQTFRTIVPLLWGQHASIMMYISALNTRMTPQTLVFIINTGNWHVFIHVYLETSRVWTLSVIIKRVAEPFDWRLLGRLRFSSCSLHLQIWFLIKIEGEAISCCTWMKPQCMDQTAKHLDSEDLFIR